MSSLTLRRGINTHVVYALTAPLPAGDETPTKYLAMRQRVASLRTFRRVTFTHVPYMITVQSSAGVATITAKQTSHQTHLLILSAASRWDG